MRRTILMGLGIVSTMLLCGQGVYQMWGMTQYGGEFTKGVLFRTDALGNNFQVKHKFNYDNKGHGTGYSQPIEFGGKFYGMTRYGGSYNKGVIFEWDPITNIFTKKFDFRGINGAEPFGSLTLKRGKLYGMTDLGGDYGAGVIFEWDPATNEYIKKFDFNGTNGANPWGSLTIAGEKLYGMTRFGGINNVGVIFEWNPNTNLYKKKVDLNCSEGCTPSGDLTLGSGIFYGMTYQGGTNSCGVIFQWNPATNVYTNKINLSSDSGRLPQGSLTKDGAKFYGMTALGGSNDAGVIFEWNPMTNVYTKKADFSSDLGGVANGNLTSSMGKFYGLTLLGGNSGAGVIFEWDPRVNVLSKRFEFDNIQSSGTSNSGSGPSGSLTFSRGKFYGTAGSGGANGFGVIFEWSPSTNIYSKRFDLGVSGGGHSPAGRLTPYRGKLYGTTSTGGEKGGGVIFVWDPTSDLFTKMIDLDETKGYRPFGNLTLIAGKFYGMTNKGGSKGYGVIFEWDPVTNVYTKKIDFNGTNGAEPSGSLTIGGKKLYGMTRYGGANNKGVIFEWDPVTNIFIKKIDFNRDNGAEPIGSLSLKGGKFYGMTNHGGGFSGSGEGVIFEWDPVTNLCSLKFDFSSYDNGANPYGDLTLLGEKFYGATSSGGANNYPYYSNGVIFEWDPLTNEFTKKIDFNFTRYVSPCGSLAISGKKFYGMTRLGRSYPYSNGELFEWDPVHNDYSAKQTFDDLGILPGNGNDLSLAPAPVAKGLRGSCIEYQSITIDSDNNNQWVPIVDNIGNAVAEIKANGNNLGTVKASMFINNGKVREDRNRKLYLNRNITLTSQVQPVSPVDIRLYIIRAEYQALKYSVNSNGQPSGISSINDIALFRVDESCSSVSSVIIKNPVATTVVNWETDYVFSASINSFSSFYFAGKCPPEPLHISQVNVRPSVLWPPNHGMETVTVNYKTGANCGPVTSSLSVASNEAVSGTGYNDKTPDWEIVDNHHVKLRAERSNDGNGRIYTITIQSIDGSGNISTEKTTVVVPLRKRSWNSVEGYVDWDGDDHEQFFDCKVMPNPSKQFFRIQVTSSSDEKLEGKLLDQNGRLIQKLNTIKDGTFRFGDDLRPGVYMVEITQGKKRKTIKVVKQ